MPAFGRLPAEARGDEAKEVALVGVGVALAVRRRKRTGVGGGTMDVLGCGLGADDRRTAAGGGGRAANLGVAIVSSCDPAAVNSPCACGGAEMDDGVMYDEPPAIEFHEDEPAEEILA